MNKKPKLGQEPAFPKKAYRDQELYFHDQGGMSKRFYAACAAMNGILSNPVVINNELSKTKIVADAYEFADELLRQEKK